jgi:hypothetical protein
VAQNRIISAKKKNLPLWTTCMNLVAIDLFHELVVDEIFQGLRGDNKEEKMRFMNFLRVSSENENFLNKF